MFETLEIEKAGGVTTIWMNRADFHNAFNAQMITELTGAFHADMQFDETDWRSKRGMLGGLNLFRTMFGSEHFPRNLQAVEELKALAARYDKTLPQFALRWTLAHPAIHTGLVGFRRPEEVDENLDAVGFTISPQDMAAIDAIFARNGVVTEPPGWLEDDPID